MKTNSKVDRLGLIAAQVAALQAEASKIKKVLLKNYEDGNVFGQLFEVNLVHEIESQVLDKDALIKKFGLTAVNACTKKKVSTRVTIHARSAE